MIVFQDGVVGDTDPQEPNAGYYWGGFGPTTEDIRWFKPGPDRYNDETMRQAVHDANSSGQWQASHSDN